MRFVVLGLTLLTAFLSCAPEGGEAWLVLDPATAHFDSGFFSAFESEARQRGYKPQVRLWNGYAAARDFWAGESPQDPALVVLSPYLAGDWAWEGPLAEESRPRLTWGRPPASNLPSLPMEMSEAARALGSESAVRFLNLRLQSPETRALGAFWVGSGGTAKAAFLEGWYAAGGPELTVLDVFSTQTEQWQERWIRMIQEGPVGFAVLWAGSLNESLWSYFSEKPAVLVTDGPAGPDAEVLHGSARPDPASWARSLFSQFLGEEVTTIKWISRWSR